MPSTRQIGTDAGSASESSVLALAGMGMWTADPIAETVTLQASMAALFCKAETNVARPFREFAGSLSDRDMRRLQIAAARASRDGRPFQLDCTIDIPGQARRLMRIGGRAFGDHAEMLAGFCQDISEQQRLEQTLRRAERLSAMGRLTGGIAHDFNNLLTVITHGLELALAREPDETVAEPLREASRAAARGAALTGQLMAFAGSSPLRSEVVALAPFLADLVSMVGCSFSERHSIVLASADTALTVQCDPRMLETVLLGLLINAREAMPQGGRIELSMRRVNDKVINLSKGRAAIAVAVSDSGHGMDAAQMAQAVEPFYTTKPAGEGSGLSLSMAEGFARQSGGALHLDSVPGEGTTVTLLLPDAATTVPRAELEGGAGTAPLDVLLVEDDTSVRTVAVAVMERLGARVVPVASAEEALEMLASEVSFDLLFSDIVLGSGMNGFELGRRAHQMQPGIGLLFTSGYNEAAGPARSSPELADSELLAKPYSVTALQSAVQRAIVRAQAAKAKD